MSYKKYWYILSAVIGISFAVLLYYGGEIYREKPPIPLKIIDANGNLIAESEDILDGQNVWHSTGGQQLGSVWGHGAYIAPDWTADWLHREAVFILNDFSRAEFGVEYEKLDVEKKAALKARLIKDIRFNSYDPETETVAISEVRARAYQSNSEHYRKLFMNDPEYLELRKAYAMKNNTIQDEDRMEKLNAFFFWTAWAAVTQRPGQDISYTNNWPHEELVENKPAGSLMLWTGFSVIMLIAGIGGMIFLHASTKEDHPDSYPVTNPMAGLTITPSMHAILKYLWVVVLLIVAQIISGIVTAHYGVEGQAFYSIPIADFMPYSLTRTWHVQLGIFWIATSWLATGMFIAPAISGYEPKYQKFGVNFLFIALLIIVVGSLAGQWFGIMQKLGYTANFWFGHQGLEYVDLGRFWQIFLFVGLIIWLVLMFRPLMPAIKKADENKPLLILFAISIIAIALFYGAGLMWGQRTHLAITEYWRWWVVHLWVEGFFEVFATVVIAFLFVKLGLLKIKTATVASLTSTTVFLSGGILGTFHHLYFSGTPIEVLALGATFSALEVVPLVMIGFEVFHNLKISKATVWLEKYKWAIYSFIAVAFWNLVGAGIFGFLINPPIALYYMQGLNTTPLHGHTALFGVYGMLGIGLMLFVLRSMNTEIAWNEKLLKYSFWSINIGLAAMALLSLLPVGLLQTIASVNHGLWYARSAEFLQTPVVGFFKWMRVFGDTIFAIGAIGFAWFVLTLKVNRK
ncbi:MAG: nitric-oxide reductase large subunit [Candidatus Kapabacteria bacterium]|nr:nitric-oxide reductase large subunit [Ignavibacteriota bacterium]MCW5885934.1 nitric-oxide reductase large subunit [Candidatus Kapabacteria bacterium]